MNRLVAGGLALLAFCAAPLAAFAATGPVEGPIRYIGAYNGEQQMRSRSLTFAGSVVFDVTFDGDRAFGAYTGVGGITGERFTGTRSGESCSFVTSIGKAVIEGVCDARGFVGEIRPPARSNLAFSIRFETVVIDVRDGPRYNPPQALNPVYERVVNSRNYLDVGRYQSLYKCGDVEKVIALQVDGPSGVGQRGEIRQYPPSNGPEFEVEIVLSEDGLYRLVAISGVGATAYERNRHGLTEFGATLRRVGYDLVGQSTDVSCGPLAFKKLESNVVLDRRTLDSLTEALIEAVRTPPEGPRCPRSELIRSGIPGHLECR